MAPDPSACHQRLLCLLKPALLLREEPNPTLQNLVPFLPTFKQDERKEGREQRREPRQQHGGLIFLLHLKLVFSGGLFGRKP